MNPRVTRVVAGLAALLFAGIVHAYYATCPAIATLKTKTIFSNASCTSTIAPGSTWLEPDTVYEVWVGGGSWTKVDVSCRDMGADSGERQGPDKAEYFYFGLKDPATHECTACFDCYSFAKPPFETLTWYVKRADAPPPPPVQTLGCVQQPDDNLTPLTFSCTLQKGTEPVANAGVYYKVRMPNTAGAPVNAFDHLLNNAYHWNDTGMGYGGLDTAGTWITGTTDAHGVSKIRLFLDFGKMTASVPPNLFPSQRYPMTLTVYASTTPDFTTAPSTQFGLALDSLGGVDQIWVAEAPGCLKPLDCTQATSVEPSAAKRKVYLDTYRLRTKDGTPRLVLARPADLGDREIRPGDRIQGGDRLHFDANGILPTICPSCTIATRGDGSPEPGYVFAKLSFWDGVKGLVVVNSSYPGTYDLAFGTIASDKLQSYTDRFIRWGRAKLVDKAVEKPIEWFVTRAIPSLKAVNEAKDFIEWTVEGLEGNEWGRAIFVNVNSAIHAQTVPGGTSKLTTVEGRAVLYPRSSDAEFGAVTTGATADMAPAAAIPRIRATTAAEAQAASEGLAGLAASCRQEAVLHNNINSGACALGSTATFTLDRASSVSRLAVWYNTKAGGSRLGYTLEGRDESIAGSFYPMGCDPYQSQWCLGEASLNRNLDAGTYTIRTPADAVCRNAASGNVGFSVVYGCPLPASAAGAVNYQGLWWNPAESGWGINFAHQGDVIFATWYTYGTDGKPWWLIATLARSAAGSYGGDVYTVAGPAFGLPWDKTRIKGTKVGTMGVAFDSADGGVLSYTVNDVTRTKTIAKQIFGTAAPACFWGAQSDLGLAKNYQDLWWNAPAESESGWGINLTHQGDTIYATWYTYDADGKPWWLAAALTPAADGAYTGAVSSIAGPPFGAEPWDPSRLKASSVGTMSARFADGNRGTLAYSVNGVTQTKSIIRDVFVPPGTVCQ